MDLEEKKRMQYVYGPVPSRRLGQSLGLDPIPFKTCNWNCVYCQLGRSTPMVNVRREYVPPEDLLDEVQKSLDAHPAGTIDWITFVGSGEPTLHAKLGYMIGRIHTMTDLPVAVITNGSLLYQPDVRKDLMGANAVLPSLDAGSEALYRKINRPFPDLTFERLVSGMARFRREYEGHLWVEVMLIKGINDTEAVLRDIASAIKQIGPDEVHVNLPIRPPGEPWVHPSDAEGIRRAQTILGDIAKVMLPAEGDFDLSGYESVIDAVAGVITRHPMWEDELEKTLERWAPGQVREALANLEQSGKVKSGLRYGKRYWSCVGGHYANKKPVRSSKNGSSPT